jgi:hypothetical protein
MELSDVKIVFKVNVKDYRGKFSHVGDHVIYAHKVVLAAGSRAFRDYFETHTQVRPTRRAFASGLSPRLTLTRKSALPTTQS